MASRANKDNREDVPTYGAPLGPPTPKPEREAERKRKLETKPTAEERRKLLEEHEERGEQESARREAERKAEAEKPKEQPRTIGPATGRPTVDIIRERGEDIEEVVEEEVTGEKRAPAKETEPVMAPRKKKKRK